MASLWNWFVQTSTSSWVLASLVGWFLVHWLETSALKKRVSNMEALFVARGRYPVVHYVSDLDISLYLEYPYPQHIGSLFKSHVDPKMASRATTVDGQRTGALSVFKKRALQFRP